MSFAGAPLPADLQLTRGCGTARHLRVRRWDQSGEVKDAARHGARRPRRRRRAAASSPCPASPATQVVLEHGVVVSFDTTGAPFRTGDHWIVPARAADAVGGAVDEPTLVDAPPLGIHHHYARLGVLTFPDGETDCRTPWPECECDGGGCSDCTVCVTPESHASGALTIQAAVDQVRELGGGTVCLAIGVYRLDDDGVLIDSGVSIRLRGQGLRDDPARRRRAASGCARARSSPSRTSPCSRPAQQPAVSLRSTAADHGRPHDAARCCAAPTGPSRRSR